MLRLRSGDDKIKRHAEQTDDVQNDTFTGKLTDLPGLAKKPELLRLLMPYDIGLSAPSPTTLKVSVNGITNTFDERYYSFGKKQTITVNTQTDNALEIERGIGKIVIYAPRNFGQITAVYVDGIAQKQQQDCSLGCILLFQPEKTLEISATNMWGGIASIESPPPMLPEPPVSDEPNYGLVAAVIIAFGTVLFVWKKFQHKN